jgi:MFS family permease
VLRTDGGKAAGKKKAGGEADGGRVLTSGPVLTMLVFFILIALASTGVQTFAVTALVDMHGISLATANAALTAFLVGGFLGVILGGFVADRLRRPAITVTGTMVAAAIGLALVGLFDLPMVVLIAVMGIAGAMIGIMRPARDMMVNSITPPGTTGKVFGFVSTGLSAGSGIAPVALGWIIDMGAPGWVFALIVGFIVTSILIATLADRMAGGAREANLRAAETPAE